MGAQLRLVPVAAAAWAVAGLVVFVPAIAAPAAAVLWALALGLLVVIARGSGTTRSTRTGSVDTVSTRVGPGRTRSRSSRTVAVVSMLAALGSAGVASHVAFVQPARVDALTAGIDGGRAVELVAVVVGKVETRADGTLAFDASSVELVVGADRRTLRVDVAVRVAPADVEGALLDVGATVRVAGTAQPANPGQRAVLSVQASRGLEVLRAPDGLLGATADLRRGLVDAVAGLPGRGAELVPGLAVGDTSIVGPELDAAMKASSLAHLTAVSGANCALVVGLAFGLAGLLGLPRAVRVAAGIGALVGFVVLVTPEPSVVRAGAMAAIAMLAVLLGRPAVGMSLLSLAVAVLLVLDPWLAGSLGFAMSVAATGSLLLAARPLARGLERWLPRALALALAVPLAAQLATGPLLVLIAPVVPVYGVLANLLAAPAAPVATIIGLAACLAAPLPWLQDGLAAIAWLPASWIAATAGVVTSLPGDQLPWVGGPAGAVLLAGVGVAIGLVVAVRPDASPRRRAARILAAVGLAVVVGVVTGIGALGSVVGRFTLPAQWSMLACDVGQGDAVLLRSGGAVALIDTGPDPAALEACLSRVGVGRIDLLVLSHFDLDHVAGVSAVAGRVGTVLYGPVGDAAARSVLDELAAGGARLTQAATGLRGSLGDARWSVLWPRPDNVAFTIGNDTSLVLDVRGGGIPPTLLLGDLSASPQRAVAASGLLAPGYAVVKVAHHGSADQSPELYAQLRPAVAIVPVGTGNRYGHPRAETLTVLGNVGARVARTDLDGVVALTWGGGPVEVWRERGSVGPGG